MKTVRRIEWRGDLFASDLAPVLSRLAETARLIDYSLPHTLTIFLRPPDSDFNLDGTLRVRSYCALSGLEPDSIHHAVARGLAGKLQVKAPRGQTTELLEGPLLFLHATAEREGGAWGRLQVGDRTLEPASVRVARRVHYELAPATRVTVDLERSLFRVAGGVLRPLGEMGPRIEIKAARSRDVRAALELLNSQGALRRLRFGSLELLFQDLLREVVRPASGKAKPEIEVKFELADLSLAAAASMVVHWLDRNPETRLLLPKPHQVVRMRRYHFCEGDDAAAQNTIVETTAGRLSAKVKRNEAVRGLAIVRATEASRTTNLDGAQESVALFAQNRSWNPFNAMTKIQSKIPFVFRNGHAYLISLDHCVDAHGHALHQLELEAIGSLGALPSVNTVVTELQTLAGQLQAELPQLLRGPTTESKFSFYRRHAQ